MLNKVIYKNVETTLLSFVLLNYFLKNDESTL
jgi:hypothetical protein